MYDVRLIAKGLISEDQQARPALTLRLPRSAFTQSPTKLSRPNDHFALNLHFMVTMAQTLSVSELNAHVAALLHEQLAMLSVRGEAQGVKRYPSGHIYFSLKDANASVSCVMFKQRAQLFERVPNEGELIEVRAKATLYEPRGDYQLRVEGWKAAGQGALYEAFLQLKNKLQAQGLFAAQNKRPLPQFAHTIGIVTSLQAAVLRDVATTLASHAPHAKLIIYPSAVQGAQAGAALAQAVHRANEHGQADVLLICRGGGSMEDLWPFNDEALARAIAASKIPVISGVGHETDFTIADFVADIRAPTPTAAAQMCTKPRSYWLDRLDTLRRSALRSAQNQLAKHSQTLDRLEAKLSAASPRAQLTLQTKQLSSMRMRLHHAALRKLSMQKQLLSTVATRLPHARSQQMHQYQTRVEVLAAGLYALSPQRVLERGYAVVMGASGQALLAPSTVGERVTLQLAQGKQEATLL